MLGQANFTDAAPATGNNRMNNPSAVAVSTTSPMIFVADTGNHRVRWWNSVSDLINGQDASGVLGQADFTLVQANRGGACQADTLSSPAGVAFDSAGNLWVADTGNNRAVRYSPPFSNGKAAGLVLGQANFTANQANRGGGITSATLSGPKAVAAVGGAVWVADSANNRVLRFPAPVTDGGAANLVLGQRNYVTGEANWGGIGVQPYTLSDPSGLSLLFSGEVMVADRGNNRVLRYPPPFIGGMNADVVLGQLDRYHGDPNRGSAAAANTLAYPSGVAADNAGSIWVADTANNRIVKYSPPLIEGDRDQSADLVLGQSVFISTQPNQGGVSASTLSGAKGIFFDATGNAWAADSANNRVLKYTAMAVNSVSPNSAYNSGHITGMTVSGRQFPDNSFRVSLRRNGQLINDASHAFVNATTLTCSFDLGGAEPGAWDVIVSTAGPGSRPQSAALMGGFTVRPMVVSSMSVTEAANTGPAAFDVFGEGFVAASAVFLRRPNLPDVPASAASLVNTGKLAVTFNLTGMATGFWDVVVSTGGFAAMTALLADGLNLFPLEITSVAPNRGANYLSSPVIEITGRGFAAGCQVKLAKAGEVDIPATGVYVAGATRSTCTFDLGGKAEGRWNVVMTTGALSAVLENGFEVAGLILDSISPASGVNNGSLNVTIDGVGFAPGTQARLSKDGEEDIPATGLTVVCSSRIVCTFDLYPHTPGFWDVVVTTGSRGDTLASAFEVVPPFSLSSITPSSGINTAPVEVTALAGQGLVNGVSVKLSKAGETDIPATDLVIVDAGRISCRFDITDKSKGQWDVVISSGPYSYTFASGFEVKFPVIETQEIGAAGGAVTLKAENGEITALIPPGALPGDTGFSVAAIAPPAADRGTIQLTAVGVELTNAQGYQPREAITLTVNYRASDAAGLDESKLVIGRYDELRAAWVPLISEAHPEQNYVTTKVRHLSRFVLMQLLPGIDPARIRAAPNPFRAGRESVVIRFFMPEAGAAEFTVFSEFGEKIFSLALENLVQGLNEFSYDGRDAYGKTLFSGSYVCELKKRYSSREATDICRLLVVK
ncbi:MAG: NHL repeat-containing protein [Endomicrobiales bacterium]